MCKSTSVVALGDSMMSARVSTLDVGQDMQVKIGDEECCMEALVSWMIYNDVARANAKQFT
jgi:sRNA-binding protein